MDRPAVLPVAAVWTAVAAVVVALGGCGVDVEREEAAAAADAFTASVASDPSAACALLAPTTLESVEEDAAGCAEGLAEAGLPAAGDRESVAVAGHSAQVRYAGETVFLALFDDGWLVTAAGCRRSSADPAVPYDCGVEGS